MRARIIRRWIGKVHRWPVHPQWLLTARSHEKSDLERSLAQLRGQVLDVGCASKHLATLLPAECDYIGIDYPDTAVRLYHTRPDIFADARSLPFASASFQGVILKDVLEHVRDPEAALSEIGRVLSDDGRLIVWMPFVYPIHDAPHDFQRFTEHGLRSYLGAHGLCVIELVPVLSPIETAALMTCLALADAAEQIVLRQRWLLPLVPVLALMVLISNLVGWGLSWLPSTRFMPAFYRIMAMRETRHQGDRGA